MREIYLAGGCYWGVQKFMDSLAGVKETEVGFANGAVEAPSYARVKQGDTGHAETVRVRYDEERIPLPSLLRLFFRIIDPTSLNRQGHDEGTQYRVGVYWTDPADEPAVREEIRRLAEKYDRPLVLEALPLRCFYPAEEYHQKYLDKTPGGYCHVPWEDIRWAAGIDPRDY